MTVDVVFRGDLVPGSNIFDVKQALQQTFKLDEARVEKMFAGKPVVLKRSISEEEAQKYAAAFFRVGAQVELKATAAPVADSDKPESNQADVEGNEELSVKPTGSDMLLDSERDEQPPVEVDTSGLVLAPDGAEMLDDKDKQSFVPKDIDTSSIDLE